METVNHTTAGKARFSPGAGHRPVAYEHPRPKPGRARHLPTTGPATGQHPTLPLPGFGRAGRDPIPMPILPLPQFEADLEADRKVYEALKPPKTIVVRF